MHKWEWTAGYSMCKHCGISYGHLDLYNRPCPGPIKTKKSKEDTDTNLIGHVGPKHCQSVGKK